MNTRYLSLIMLQFSTEPVASRTQFTGGLDLKTAQDFVYKVARILSAIPVDSDGSNLLLELEFSNGEKRPYEVTDNDISALLLGTRSSSHQDLETKWPIGVHLDDDQKILGLSANPHISCWYFQRNSSWEESKGYVDRPDSAIY